MKSQDIEPIWVKPGKAKQLMGLGLTRVYELMNDGTLENIRVGGSRLVKVESIRRLGETA